MSFINISTIYTCTIQKVAKVHNGKCNTDFNCCAVLKLYSPRDVPTGYIKKVYRPLKFKSATTYIILIWQLKTQGLGHIGN